MSEQKTMDDVIREIREDLAKWEHWASPETVVKDVPMNEVSDVYYRQCEVEMSRRRDKLMEAKDGLIGCLLASMGMASMPDLYYRSSWVGPLRSGLYGGCIAHRVNASTSDERRTWSVNT